MNDFERACEDIKDGEVLGLSTQDNAIEFMRNSKTVTATLCQPRYITKIKRLAEQYPDEVQILHTNNDSSIVCHFPTSYLKISRPREYTKEQRELMAERLKGISRNK